MPILAQRRQKRQCNVSNKILFLHRFSIHLANFFYTSKGLYDASDPVFLKIRIWIFLPDPDPDLRQKGQDFKKIIGFNIV